MLVFPCSFFYCSYVAGPTLILRSSYCLQLLNVRLTKPEEEQSCSKLLLLEGSEGKISFSFSIISMVIVVVLCNCVLVIVHVYISGLCVYVYMSNPILLKCASGDSAIEAYFTTTWETRVFVHGFCAQALSR